MIKLVNHFLKLFGDLPKTTKAKAMHKLGKSNYTPRYTSTEIDNMVFFNVQKKKVIAALLIIIQWRRIQCLSSIE